MTNKSLIQDHLIRSRSRLMALKVLLDEKNYADVVRESQEIVELVSKSLLRHFGIEPARVHDVSSQLADLQDRVTKSEQKGLEELIEISRRLRRDRELAFYGTADLTPIEFYEKKDADMAFKGAEFSFNFVTKFINP